MSATLVSASPREPKMPSHPALLALFDRFSLWFCPLLVFGPLVLFRFSLVFLLPLVCPSSWSSGLFLFCLPFCLLCQAGVFLASCLGGWLLARSGLLVFLITSVPCRRAGLVVSSSCNSSPPKKKKKKIQHAKVHMGTKPVSLNGLRDMGNHQGNDSASEGIL